MCTCYGVLRAGFTDNKADIESLVQHLKTTELPRDEVLTVSTKTSYVSTGSDNHACLTLERYFVFYQSRVRQHLNLNL
jgi:mannose-6-phosphate isomerase class I